jgi:hypothetical protein
LFVDTYAEKHLALELKKLSHLYLLLIFGWLYGSNVLHHGIVELIDMDIEKKSFLKSLGFWREVAIVEKCICPLCADKVDEDEFRNEVFIKEFKSSGLCQGCQDTVFGYKVAW